ncbi:hypothetical protein RFI_11349 [Reticulomyxa filosa]|uniref:Kelch motif family protein n=1 Tax=Reticulomyxa filosa TaxID=46433 RepID=X6NIH7_RETFI|nr:hypothetical protein RFI_11349 [Reticulomyxa filosa]|eukprot:ETO25786.1 hypothetical protein RFI_11349 [Reticulomyxa filosa]
MQTHQVSNSSLGQANSPYFETLETLPCLFRNPQCILFDNEIIICGGLWNSGCFSYHILKNEYKRVCAYPTFISRLDTIVIQHEATIWFFCKPQNQVMILKYQSVWDESNEPKNEIVPIDNLENLHYETLQCVVIGGSKDGFLFLVHPPNVIQVLNLKSLELVAQNVLPIERATSFTSFIKVSTGLILFHEDGALHITYTEQTRTFDYKLICICPNLVNVISFSCICIKDLVVVFGGFNENDGRCSDQIQLYSTTTKKWKLCSHKLPKPMARAFAIVNKENTFVHIVGGWDEEHFTKNHIKIKKEILIGVVKVSSADKAILILSPTNEELQVVLSHWFRLNKTKRYGWIKEFNIIIENFL